MLFVTILVVLMVYFCTMSKLQETSSLQSTVVLFHAHCPDGMASAWVAWKKFGNNATYIPVSDRKTPPEGLTDKVLFIIDFCYPKETLQDLLSTNKNVIVLDHHVSCADDVTSIPEGQFDKNRSGAGMAWDYFFAGLPRPKLINYIEVGDLNPHNLPEGEFLSQRIIATPFTVEAYDEIITQYEVDEESLISDGKAISLYVDHLFEIALDDYDMVLFEGYTMPAINIALPLTTKSQLLMRLYTKIPPIAMTYRYEKGHWKISLRSDGTVDCSLLAQKYGGGGHRGSAGFIVKASHPLPFVREHLDLE